MYILVPTLLLLVSHTSVDGPQRWRGGMAPCAPVMMPEDNTHNARDPEIHSPTSDSLALMRALKNTVGERLWQLLRFKNR